MVVSANVNSHFSQSTLGSRAATPNSLTTHRQHRRAVERPRHAGPSPQNGGSRLSARTNPAGAVPAQDRSVPSVQVTRDGHRTLREPGVVLAHLSVSGGCSRNIGMISGSGHSSLASLLGTLECEAEGVGAPGSFGSSCPFSRRKETVRIDLSEACVEGCTRRTCRGCPIRFARPT
jgi:hypothetical protein